MRDKLVQFYNRLTSVEKVILHFVSGFLTFIVTATIVMIHVTHPQVILLTLGIPAITLIGFLIWHSITDDYDCDGDI